jgi:orotidine-5'-phosphate decarboxylase
MSQKQFWLMPALDSDDLELVVKLVASVGDMSFIKGFKLGFILGLTHGLPEVVKRLKDVTEKPLIYDHQKAGTDIPATGAQFAQVMVRAGIDEAILFPQAGPETSRAWIKSLKKHGIGVISGGLMTHPGYILSEGGYLADERIPEMYRLAQDEGVNSFVVPLTRPDATRAIFPAGSLSADMTFYSPGFGAQGGDPAAFDFISRHCIIAGRSFFAAPDPRAYVLQVQAQLEGSVR